MGASCPGVVPWMELGEKPDEGEAGREPSSLDDLRSWACVCCSDGCEGGGGPYETRAPEGRRGSGEEAMALA